jgi:hypothetical protein
MLAKVLLGECVLDEKEQEQDLQESLNARISETSDVKETSVGCKADLALPASGSQWKVSELLHIFPLFWIYPDAKRQCGSAAMNTSAASFDRHIGTDEKRRRDR